MLAKTPLFWRLVAPKFAGSKDYWEQRYVEGGTSGYGSYGELARFKAEVVNAFVTGHNVATVAELGCGDGNQLMLAEYPQYLGFDVSRVAIKICEEKFRNDTTKKFFLDDGHLDIQQICVDVDLALSLDVIYHLVEDKIFQPYMDKLFGASRKYVIIYSSDTNANDHATPHVRHRKFTPYVAEKYLDWRLTQRIPQKFPIKEYGEAGSFADFFIYEKA